MLYAKVVFGLPIDGPFDYSVPSRFTGRIKPGMRVWVSFRTRRMLGYVVGLTPKTEIRNIKPILEVMDRSPILNKNMLIFTRRLSDYYCCSWGEAIATALPEGLRKGRQPPEITKEGDKDSGGIFQAPAKQGLRQDAVLLHALDSCGRWDTYLKEIKEAITHNKSAIILLPDVGSIFKAQDIIGGLGACSSLGLLYRKQPKELEAWAAIKQNRFQVVLGTRSSIFAPLDNLGLVIIDEEQDEAYKQDQVPHYHAREAAFMRTDIEKARLILGSAAPSLESFYLAKQERIKYIYVPRKKDFPEVKISDMHQQPRGPKQRGIFLSRPLEDNIASAVGLSGKVLLFINRKGFATIAFCRYCGTVLKCPRCSINLVYHFQDKILICHYCNFKMEAPNICTQCNCGYIQYRGYGAEKIESELSRIFPGARIKRLDSSARADIKDADILVATEAIMKEARHDFDLIGILSIDNSLNRIDFRSGEKAFVLLTGLLGLTVKRIVIQTYLPKHHCFEALQNKDIDIFYNEELRHRKQLCFPPYRHLGLIKLRGPKEDKVREAGNALFQRLRKAGNRQAVDIVAVNPAAPSKLRGNFYWQVLIKANSPKRMSRFLKIHLKGFLHSGIIVTVDIDPL